MFGLGGDCLADVYLFVCLREGRGEKGEGGLSACSYGEGWGVYCESLRMNGRGYDSVCVDGYLCPWMWMVAS
jgi:hypothetical protein